MKRRKAKKVEYFSSDSLDSLSISQDSLEFSKDDYLREVIGQNIHLTLSSLDNSGESVNQENNQDEQLVLHKNEVESQGKKLKISQCKGSRLPLPVNKRPSLEGIERRNSSVSIKLPTRVNNFKPHNPFHLPPLTNNNPSIPCVDKYQRVKSSYSSKTIPRADKSLNQRSTSDDIVTVDYPRRSARSARVRTVSSIPTVIPKAERELQPKYFSCNKYVRSRIPKGSYLQMFLARRNPDVSQKTSCRKQQNGPKLPSLESKVRSDNVYQDWNNLLENNFQLLSHVRDNTKFPAGSQQTRRLQGKSKPKTITQSLFDAYTSPLPPIPVAGTNDTKHDRQSVTPNPPDSQEASPDILMTDKSSRNNDRRTKSRKSKRKKSLMNIVPKKIIEEDACGSKVEQRDNKMEDIKNWLENCEKFSQSSTPYKQSSERHKCSQQPLSSKTKLLLENTDDLIKKLHHRHEKEKARVMSILAKV